MAQWWEAAPIAAPKAAPQGGNWWEAAPRVNSAGPATTGQQLTLEQRIMQGYHDVAGGPTAQAAATTAAAPEEPSLTDKIMSGFDYAGHTAAIGLREFRRGAANFAGIPVDMVNASPRLLNLLPGEGGYTAISPEPFMGSKFIDDALSGFGTVPEPAPPQDAFQRVVGRTGQELGAAAVPTGAALGVARAVGVEGARALPGLARMFVEPAAVNGAKFVGKEAAAAGAAGLGASGINEVTRAAGVDPDSVTGRIGDVLGALAGAVTYGGGMAAGRKLSQIAKAVFGSERYADDVVRETVTDRILQEAGARPARDGEPINADPLVAQIMGGPRVADKVPGFQESLADRTGNSGLAALEYSRQSGENSGLYTQRKADNTAAIDTAMERSAPNGTPGAFTDELALERDRRLMETGVQTRNARDDFDQATQNLTSVLTAEARGQGIREALEDVSDQAKHIVTEAWKPLNEADVSVDVAPLNERFQGIEEGTSRAENQNFRPAAANIPASFGEESVQPLREVTGIRSVLASRLREDITPQERRVVQQHIDALDNYLDQNVPAELMGQYDAARALRRDYADRFERPQTAIAQSLARREGQYSQDASVVPRRFVQADQGKIADFEALMREAGTDERVQTGVRDQILSDVQSRGLLERPDQLEEYLNQYGTVFRRFPQLRDELGNAAGLRRQLDTAAAGESELMREIGPQGRGVVAKYLQYGDENADRAMKGVLASKDPARSIDELLTFVNDDPKAVEGARKVFWDLMQKQTRSGGETTATVSGAQPWMPNRLRGFLSDPRNAAVAERLWRDNPEHLTNIREIAESIQNVDIRNRARAGNTSGTAQGFNALLTPETLQSRIYAYKSGKINLAFLVASTLGVTARRGVKGARANAIEKLLDQSLLNPDIAALLVKENNPANRAALARRAKGWLGNEASTVINLLNDAPENDDERLKKTINRAD